MTRFSEAWFHVVAIGGFWAVIAAFVWSTSKLEDERSGLDHHDQ